jgi:hypothetical protein
VAARRLNVMSNMISESIGMGPLFLLYLLLVKNARNPDVTIPLTPIETLRSKQELSKSRGGFPKRLPKQLIAFPGCVSAGPRLEACFPRDYSNY